MPKIIATGGGTDEELKQGLIRAIWEKFSSLDKFSKTLVITTVLFLVFASAITTFTLSLRSNAGGGGISRVDVNPGSLNLLVGKTQAMSTLAYDNNGNPVFSGVVYEWSMSSASSAATLTKTIGDITELTALNSGCSQLTVIARDGIATVTKSIQVVVSDSPNTIPACSNITPTPVQPNEAYFKFDYPPYLETFVIKLMDSSKIQEARNIISNKLPKHIAGNILKGQESYNSQWSFYLEPTSINFFDTAEEVCDLNIKYVQDNLDKVGTVLLPDSKWCPWRSRLIEEVSNGPTPTAPYVTKAPTPTFTPPPKPTKTPIPTQKPPSPTPSPTKTPPPPTQTIIDLIPIADAYVRSDLSNRSFGSERTLIVDASPKTNSYLKFDLSSLAGRKIVYARLRIYVNDSNAAGSSGIQNLRAVSNSNWSETSITYKNAPSAGSTIVSNSIATRNTFLYFDLTNWVISNQGRLATMSVQTGSGDNVLFSSRENPNGYYRPVLTVTLQ